MDDIITMTYLEPVKNRLIKNLSKGYKQRVGLAQALIGNPEILILDEPTVGLDPKQIIEIRSLIKELSREHTVILSSHILSEVSALCDTIMIISHGKLVACDTPENLSRSMEGTTTLEICVRDQNETVEALLRKYFGDRAAIDSNAQQKETEEINTQEPEGNEDLEKTTEDTKKVVTEQAAEKEIWRGTIKTEGADDIREELFYLLAEAKCPILEMKQSKLSLEDIFLELTQEADVQEETFGNKEEKEEVLDESSL